MMTTREDPTKRDLPNAASATESGAKGEPAKKLDPWHFGAHTVPPNLRAELSNIELPDAPAERRYRPQASAVEQAEATEELRIPKRDFRRSVTMGLGALILVLSLAAAVRCATAENDDVVRPNTQPVATQPRNEAPAVATPATTGEVAGQPSAVEPPAKAPAAVSATASKSTSVGAVKPRPPSVATQPGSGLQEDRPAAPTPPPSSPPSGRIVPAED
jgi:hypothetical protein